MRILKVLACLALLGVNACGPAKPKLPTGVEFIGEFHSLCPRALRSTADAERAFAAVGAKRSRPIVNLLALDHAAPDGWPAYTALERGAVQWGYDGPRWMSLVSTAQTTVGGATQVRCKLQLSGAEAEGFDWLVQYASGSMPAAATYADGARVMLYKDRHAAPGLTAYYVLWRGLPPAVWGGKPSIALQYVTIAGAAPADPFDFQAPEATLLTRSDQYCADADPTAVAAQVASARVGAPDPDAKPKAHDHDMHAWIMRDSDEWRLRTSFGEVAGHRLNDCTIRMAGLRETVVIEALAADPRLTLTRHEAYKKGQVRQYERTDADRTLIYFIEGGPENPIKTHTLSVVEGFQAAREATQGPGLAIPRVER